MKPVSYTHLCFTNYDETIGNKLVAFEKESIENTFGEFLAAHDMTQLRLAETEKYAHVTFFFNGGVEEPNKGEERSLVKSPSVATYDLKPEMSAPEVSERLNEAIASDKYDVIVINFANPDMVGHTGVIPAAVAAVEKVDECVGTAVEAVKKADGVLFICADHGNAEQMVDYETGAPFTAHTTNPVPFVLVNYDDAYTPVSYTHLCHYCYRKKKFCRYLSMCFLLSVYFGFLYMCVLHLKAVACNGKKIQAILLLQQQKQQ